MSTSWITIGVPGHADKLIMSDGSVHDMPELEQTTSSRPRYRIKGEKKSFGKNTMWIEISDYLHRTTGLRPVKTTAGMKPHEDSEKFISEHVSDTEMQHLLQSISTFGSGGMPSNERVHFVAKFVHESGATLYVQHTLTTGYAMASATIQTSLTHPSLAFIDIDHHAYVSSSDNYWGITENRPGVTTMDLANVRTQAAAVVPSHLAPDVFHGGSKNYRCGRGSFGTPGMNPKGMFKKLFAETLHRLRATATTDSISIPAYYMGVNDNTHQLIEFKNAHEYSWNEGAIQQLCDYVSPTPQAEQVVAAFQELQKALVVNGFCVDAKNSARLFADLVLGEVPAITLLDDRGHAIYLNPSTGHSEVICNVVPSTQAVEAWEVARFKAEMSGNLDEFEGFTTTEGLKEVVRSTVIADLSEVTDLREAIDQFPLLSHA